MSRILIVDDDPANRRLLRHWLERRGHQVMEAENGVEALRLAREVRPDLVISDILMPEMDGFALCRRWQQDEALSRIPFVFYSATYTAPEDQQFALQLGAARLIPRPAEMQDFLRAVEEALQAGEQDALPAPADTPAPEETAYLKQYNAVLVRKLEEKVIELEELNRTLEQRVAERTGELRRVINLMAGREIRMAELKQVIRRLREQLQAHGLQPAADDPLHIEDQPPDA